MVNVFIAAKVSMQVYSFPPVARADARVLVLGSMPGKASLQAGQYYAHPRNLFWPFMAQIFQFDSTLEYQARCRELVQHGVALWDVLKSCSRASSLDADILADSMVVNDVIGFIKSHTQLHTICFNGAKAENVFIRALGAQLQASDWGGRLIRLPSTSPANASIPLAVKQQQWQQALC